MEGSFDFIIWGGFEFGRGRQTPIDFTVELAKKHKVLYIEHPYTLLKFLFYGKKKEIFSYLLNRFKHPGLIRKKDKNLWLMTIIKFPVFPIIYPPVFRKLTLKINSYFLNRFIGKNFTEKTIFISFTPLPFDLIKNIKSDLNLYYCVDDYTASDYLNKAQKIKTEIKKLEENFLKESDIACFTSSYLYEKKSNFAKISYILENAVNHDFFQKSTEIPKHVKKLSNPIIGYCGGFTRAAGSDLFKHLALKFNQGSIVVIGGDPVPNSLLKLGNIYFFGLRPYDEIPGYIKSFDVCLIPYKLIERTNAAFPRKLYEYFALGKPVVTTSNPSIVNSESIDQSLLYYADTPEEFVSQVEKALKEDSEILRENRIEHAKKNTWEARTKALLEILEKHMNFRNLD